MTRRIAVATLLALGAVWVPHAQQPTGGADSQTPSELEASFLGSEVYFLSNGQSNAVAVVTADGIVLVDSMSAGWGGAVQGMLQRVSYLPLTTIVHSHAHEDHTGADPEYPDSVEVVIHEAGGGRIAERTDGKGVTTFSDRMPLAVGNRQLRLFYFGRGHTDSDIIVVIPDVKAAYVGDLVVEGALPVIDPTSGGSALALPDTLARAAEELTGVEHIITGHGRSKSYLQGWPTWDDFREYAAFTREFVDAVTAAWENGRTVEQAAAELTMPARYEEYRLDGAQAMIETIFDELTQSR